MDADGWHTWCTTPLVVEPPVLTLYRWKHLSPEQFAAHTDHLDRWLRQIYLETDELAAVASKITRQVRNNAHKPPGTKDIIGLTGPNLIGKSTLMMRWGRTQYNTWIRGAELDSRGRPVIHVGVCEVDWCPIMWIDLRDMSRNSTVDRKRLNFYGLPTGGTNDAMSIAADNAVKRHGTLVIVIDDVHLLWLNWKGGQQVLDHIKHINTEFGQVGATLILVGANLEDTELVHDPQIAGRLKLHTLAANEAGDDDTERPAWQRAVKQMEDLVLPHLPAGKPGMLYREFVGELWYRSNGYVGHMTELVIEATMAATLDGTHQITQEHLDAIELSYGAEDDRRVREAKDASDNEPADVNPATKQRRTRTSKNAVQTA